MPDPVVRIVVVLLFVGLVLLATTLGKKADEIEGQTVAEEYQEKIDAFERHDLALEREVTDFEVAKKFQRLIQAGDLSLVTNFVNENRVTLERVLGRAAFEELRRGLALHTQWHCEYCGRNNRVEESQCPG